MGHVKLNRRKTDAGVESVEETECALGACSEVCWWEIVRASTSPYHDHGRMNYGVFLLLRRGQTHSRDPRVKVKLDMARTYRPFTPYLRSIFMPLSGRDP